MARKASAPKHVEPEDASQESPDDEGGTPVAKLGREAKGGETITKAAAIRRALAEGYTKYEDAGPFIKSQFGHDVSPGHFAASKSREKPAGEAAEPKKRGRKPGTTVTVKAKRGRKPKAASQAVEGYLAPPPAPKVGDSDVLETLEALKPLIAQHGADRLKRMVDLLG